MDRHVIWACDEEEELWSNGTSPHLIRICPALLLLGLLPAVLALVTIFGNLLVIAAVLFNKKLRRRHTSILIANLALADFLVGESNTSSFDLIQA